MKNFLLAVLMLSMTAVAWAEDHSKDNKEIIQAVSGFVDAWNNHDPKAMASFWAEEGDLINPWGNWGHNKKGVETLFQKDQSKEGPFNKSRLKLSVTKIRFIPDNENVAVVDVDGEAIGIKAPNVDSTTRITHHIVFVFFKQKGSWKIFAARPYKLVNDIVTDISPVEK